MFFFFFDHKSIYEFPIVKQAFYIVCGKGLEMNYYCSMEKYLFSSIRRLDYRNKLRKMKSPIASLYEKPYPKEDTAEVILDDLEQKINNNVEQGTYNLSEEEAEAIVYWVYHVYGNIILRKSVTMKALTELGELLELDNLGFAGNIIYVKDKVEINVLDNFSKYCEEIEWMDTQNHTFFFRGHADVAYHLLPSIMRNSEWSLHENDMYNELRIDCSSDFTDCRSHLDYLVEMQHYGLPTRLLDVTKNPLVALYFACESEPEKTGEIIVFDIENEGIKYPGSDVVSILASLPLLSYKEKQNLIDWMNDVGVSDALFNKNAKFLLHEIKLEKPAFQDNMKKEDVGRAVFVLSEKKNKRIIKQDGAFIVCGLFGEEENPINDFRYQCDGKIQIYVITPKAKKEIMEQLEKFSINRASLFPEIEEVSKYIKEKYS